MNTEILFGKRILISTFFPEGGGGLRWMSQFVIDALKRQGCEIKVAHYQPYSVESGLSVPLQKILTRKVGHTTRELLNTEFHKIGAFLPELEFTHYHLNRYWRELIDWADYCVTVCGNALMALPFYQTKIKFLAWVASTYDADRMHRVAMYPFVRRCVDTLLIKPVSSRLERKILKLGRILPLSAYTKGELSLLDNKIKDSDILPAPINQQQFYPDAFKTKPWRISFVGRFDDPRKNIPLLLETTAEIAKHHPQIELVLVGAKLSDELQQKIKTLNIENQVVCHSFLELSELTTLLRSVDVFVVPSLQEGLCIAALEAMASGAPVVSTRCGGVESFIEEGINGCLVNFSARNMADAIQKICEDRIKREAMAKAAF